MRLKLLGHVGNVFRKSIHTSSSFSSQLQLKFNYNKPQHNLCTLRQTRFVSNDIFVYTVMMIICREEKLKQVGEKLGERKWLHKRMTSSICTHSFGFWKTHRDSVCVCSDCRPSLLSLIGQEFVNRNTTITAVGTGEATRQLKNRKCQPM